MKIKKWIRDSLGFLPLLLSGGVGWLLDALNVEIWVIYWFLGFFGAFLAGGLLHYIDNRIEEEKDEESEEKKEYKYNE